MNVLSLFGGIETGLIALKELGVEIDNYYSSEIDKYVCSVARFNHPEIKELGDITKYKEWDIPKIDLVLAGFPCQSFSFAGKQLNFEDERGQLFFKSVELLWDLKSKNPDIKFLFENVKMKKEYEKAISEILETKSILINSALVSAQNRPRLYWASWDIKQPENKNIVLENIVFKDLNFDRDTEFWNYKCDEPSKLSGKAKCLRSQAGGKTRGVGLYNIDETKWRKLLPIECEKLQTLPANYTQKGINIDGEVVKISNTQRYKMIGNGWTKDVIKHILQGML